MKRYRIALAIGLAGFGVLVTACVAPSPPPQCDVSRMILDLADFPPGMVHGSTTKPAVDSTVNSETRTYSMVSLRFGQSAFWYPEEEYARRKFREEAEYTTGAYAYYPGWEDPLLALSDASATEYAVGCGPIRDGPACIYVARYTSVVVSVNVQFPGGEIQPDLLVRLIMAVDGRILQCVSAKTTIEVPVGTQEMPQITPARGG